MHGRQEKETIVSHTDQGAHNFIRKQVTELYHSGLPT